MARRDSNPLSIILTAIYQRLVFLGRKSMSQLEADVPKSLAMIDRISVLRCVGLAILSAGFAAADEALVSSAQERFVATYESLESHQTPDWF